MGRYTRYTRRWLDRRFRERTSAGVYRGHQPIYGLNHPACEPGHAKKLARVFGILRALAALDVRTVLDVGGGEGFVAQAARSIAGVDAISTDLSIEACRRAHDLFGLDSVAVSSHRLPFADGAFDVVISSEMVEHVEFPVESLAELERVAAKAVILTTEEIEFDRDELARYLFRRCGYPHFERNLFHPDDLAAVFGPATTMVSQSTGPLPRPPVTAAAARQWIVAATAAGSLREDGRGVVLVHLVDEAARRAAPLVGDQEILDRLLQPAARAVPLAVCERPEPLAGLAGRAVCPLCHGALATAGALHCLSCGADYPIAGGTADLTVAVDPECATTARQLAARWSPPRVAAALAMRDALDLPIAAEQRRWDFAVRADRRGWMPNEQLVERVPDSYRFRSTGGDPWLVSPGLAIDTAEVTAVELELRIHAPDHPRDAGQGQVFWLSGDDTTFDEARSVLFPLINDGQPHSYRVELRGHALWPVAGELVCLRIDPVTGPCEVDLLSFALIG